MNLIIDIERQAHSLFHMIDYFDAHVKINSIQPFARYCDLSAFALCPSIDHKDQGHILFLMDGYDLDLNHFMTNVHTPTHTRTYTRSHVCSPLPPPHHTHK